MDTQSKINVSNKVAEIVLSYRPKVKLFQVPKITSSKEAYEVLLENWDKTKLQFIEQFKVMLLNRSNRVLGVVDVSTGGTSGTVADPKIIFAAAVKSNSSGMILVHNHPSGNRFPSNADNNLTERMVNLGKLMELPVLDHIIVTSESYYSYADEGGL
ncbi:DNA repair protein [Echinicola strongylocentroti]|uniref:DNA repair protein n=1 Tax=Echinicola strongylocentroti TaxID=1795355 RepID=A0A2Z4IG84_9BACT|nr:JAB domain-containing protein [Echinicola strongylocentroti]AWW30161.1 DNA repair protein [Echinicola strongylocentroti]